MSTSYTNYLDKKINNHNFVTIELPKEGELPQKLNHYLKLISNPCIQLICEPLKKINTYYFLYVKRFNDSSHIYLTNLPEWKSYYFTNYYYLIGDFDDPDKQYQSGMFLWSGLNCQKIYSSLRDQFNIAHGITLIQAYQDCSEFFHFGSTTENRSIANFYLNNYELLKRFTLYFKDKAYEMIEAMSNCRIIMPKREEKTEDNFDILKNQIDEFVQLTQIDRYYISNDKSDTYLTKREMQCLKWYSIGKTAEEIGMILEISKRTVEYYLATAKNKISFYKKGQVVYSFNGLL